MKRLYNLLLLLSLWSRLANAAEVAEQTCIAEGVCFANDDEAAKYYEKGQYIEIEWGEKQQVAAKDWKKTLEITTKTKEYMSMVAQNETLRDIRKECKCRNQLCSFWAAIGECEKNPSYMLLQCAPSCSTCHQLRHDFRCPFDPETPLIWQPGSLNQMFERITTEEYYVKRFQPTILSRDPWVITVENVATKEECDHMIELGAKKGYERSKDVGKKNFDGTFEGVESDRRTSTNAWCVGECYNDTIHQSVLQVVENITGIPENNSEYWQFLKYEETEFYANHHDYIGHHQDRAQGVRIMTVFVYLNDVEEGGGTHFHNLNITVLPKRGRALLWPSVKNKKPNSKDSRTHHEALPVIKGIKYGANAWIHQRDFKTPYEQKCT